MATETATLIFRADTKALQDAKRRLREVKKETEDVQNKSGGLSRGFKGAAIGAAALAVSIAAVSKTLNVARQFDVISASLKTMTGSQEAADKAFAKIQDFAANTPYDLAQVATAFTKLKAMGLDPSMAALESYGNTSSAMGKSLNQMIEAVADAATGEFERLKEFGIRASKQGDQVSLTFKGITKTIGFSAAEIENYLQDIGENEFGGAMAERAATLDGALSNLGDQWDMLFLTITKSGVGSIMQETARDLTGLIATVDRAIRSFSGELTLEEQLAAAKVEMAELTKKASDLGWELDNNQANRNLSNQIDNQKVLIMTLETQIKHQNELNAAEEKGAEVARTAANEKAASEKVVQEQKIATAKLQEKLDAESLQRQIETEEQKWDATRSWFEQVEDRMESMDSHAASFAEALSSNLANSFEGLLNGTMTAKEAFESMVKGMAASMVSALATMAAEWIAYQLMQAAFGKTVAASGAAALALEAQAMSIMAGISAFASTAAIPIVGPALAPAAAASAIAITGSMAAGVSALSVSSAAARALGGQVRGGESYIVGERGPEVLTMGGIGHITTNEKMKAANDSAPAQPVAVNLNVQAADTRDFDKLLYERRGLIMSMINKAVNDRGRASL